jgi:hypothetical protein
MGIEFLPIKTQMSSSGSQILREARIQIVHICS